jgi:hypothetical protein
MRPWLNRISDFDVTAEIAWVVLANLQQQALEMEFTIVQSYVEAKFTESEENKFRQLAPLEFGGVNLDPTMDSMIKLILFTRQVCAIRLVEYAKVKMQDNKRGDDRTVVVIATAEKMAGFLKENIPGSVLFDGRDYSGSNPVPNVRCLILNRKSNSGFNLSQFSEKISLVEPGQLHDRQQLVRRLARQGQRAKRVLETFVVDPFGFWKKAHQLSAKEFPLTIEKFAGPMLALAKNKPNLSA